MSQSNSLRSAQDLYEDRTIFRHVGIVVLALCGIALALICASVIVSSSL